jgi:acylphosphatase
MAERRLHAVVRGRVQMVGFRYFVLEQAQALNLTGWVRNGDDGESVEVAAEGPENALRELEAALRRGPGSARVDEVSSDWSGAVEDHTGFRVRG